MKIISTIQEFRIWRKGIKGFVGFVPTMGALHAGHLSLVKKSGNICRNTIVSIYLNPAQFSPDEDLDSYPNKVKNDIEQISKFISFGLNNDSGIINFLGEVQCSLLDPTLYPTCQ